MQKIFIFISLIFLSFAVAAQKPAWPAELNTAKNAIYLSELQKQVILELNKVRSNPKRYAEEYLEDLKACFDGQIFTYPGQQPLKTKEGVIPLNECIQALNQTAPLPLLKPSPGLSKAARMLVTDQQKNGGIGHVSLDGSTPQRRMEKYGDWDICSAEDITYGSLEARQIVIFLLIDDGVHERSHRQNILNTCFHFAGVGYGTHPNYQSLCVIDYAGNYKEKP